MIFCWATVIANLGCMWPVASGWTPLRLSGSSAVVMAWLLTSPTVYDSREMQGESWSLFLLPPLKQHTHTFTTAIHRTQSSSIAHMG